MGVPSPNTHTHTHTHATLHTYYTCTHTCIAHILHTHTHYTHTLHTQITHTHTHYTHTTHTLTIQLGKFLQRWKRQCSILGEGQQHFKQSLPEDTILNHRTVAGLSLWVACTWGEHSGWATGKPPLPISLGPGLLRSVGSCWLRCGLLPQYRQLEAMPLLLSTEQHCLGLFLSSAQNLESEEPSQRPPRPKPFPPPP